MAKKRQYSFSERFPKFKLFLLIAVLLAIPLTVFSVRTPTNLTQNAATTCGGFVIKGYTYDNRGKPTTIPDITVPTYSTLTTWTQNDLATLGGNVYARIHPGWYLGSITGVTLQTEDIILHVRLGTQTTSNIRVPITPSGITANVNPGVPLTLVPVSCVTQTPTLAPLNPNCSFIIKGYTYNNRGKPTTIPDITVPTRSTLTTWTQNDLATLGGNIYFRIHPGWYLGSIKAATLDAQDIILHVNLGTQATSNIRVPITISGITANVNPGVPLTIVPVSGSGECVR